MGLGIGNRTTGELITASIWNTDLVAPLNAIGSKYLVAIDANALTPDVTNGCDYASAQTLTAGAPLLLGSGFSGSADQYAQFKIPMPKAWNAGTVTYRVRWTSPNALTGNVVFSLQASASTDGDAIDQAFGTAVTITDTFQAVKDQHTTSESSAITIGNTPAKQDMVYFRFGRLPTNGSDTKTDQIFVEAVELFIVTDAVNDA